MNTKAAACAMGVLSVVFAACSAFDGSPSGQTAGGSPSSMMGTGAQPPGNSPVSDSGVPSNSNSPPVGSVGGGGGNWVQPGAVQLRPVQSCSELTSLLQADARTKMNSRIDAQIKAIQQGIGTNQRAFGGGGSGSGGAGFPAAGGTNAAPAAGNANTTLVAGSASTPAQAPAHSNTETQVQGVDEADIVKTDGNYIYVLHGNQFLVVDSWPAMSLAEANSVAMEGEPLEMFVNSGSVVVFSRVDGTPISAAAGVTPRPDYSDAYFGGGYYGGGNPVGGVATGVGVAGVANAAPPAGGSLGAQVAPGNSPHPLTKVTILSLSGVQATLAREFYFEGTYLSSRRIDKLVHGILTGGAHGPAISYSPQFPMATTFTNPSGSTQTPTPDQQIAAWEALRAANEALIDQTTYADWVPDAFIKNGSQVIVNPTACQNFFVPPAGTTDFGMTQIESLDLGAPSAPPRQTDILGSVSTVYENASSMVLANQAYADPWNTLTASFPVATGTGVNGVTQAPTPVVTLDHTHLHLFDLTTDPTMPRYVASGTVAGTVKDQFALDESGWAVRVATTEQRSGPALPNGNPNEVSHVFVLEPEGQALFVVGDAGEIAPGEQLYATRYVGDKCYVVTWHVTDPLFVVDVADPRSPRVLGSVQIPGFSSYIHPLDSTHLLTIGRETDATGHQHDGGYWYGLALQVFDVTNPLAPALQYKYVYDGGEYATSEAMDDHKAFTYFDDKKLLAFPYVHNGSYGPSGPSSTLEVFRVGVAEGITKLGSVDHTALLGTLPNGNFGYCGGYYDGEVRRGVFIENFVYSISYGGIIASDVSNVSVPVATLKLTPPTLTGVCP